MYTGLEQSSKSVFLLCRKTLNRLMDMGKKTIFVEEYRN